MFFVFLSCMLNPLLDTIRTKGVLFDSTVLVVTVALCFYPFQPLIFVWRPSEETDRDTLLQLNHDRQENTDLQQ